MVSFKDMAASEELLFLDLRLTDASALCDWALPGIVPVFWGDRLVGGCLPFQGGWLNYMSTTIRAYPSDGANPRITHTIPHNLGGLLGKLRSGLNQTMLITIRKRGDVIHKHYTVTTANTNAPWPKRLKHTIWANLDIACITTSLRPD